MGSTRVKASVRRLVLVSALAIVSFAGLVSGAQARGIVFPVPDRAMNYQPVDFRGNASLDITTYSPQVNMTLYYTAQEKVNDAHGGHLQNRFSTQSAVGTGDDFIDIDGDWNIHMANVEGRFQYDLVPTVIEDFFKLVLTGLPKGAPLQDGKYDLVIFQRNIRPDNIFKGEDDPVHNRWIAAFWIDTVAPDTVIDTEVPSGHSGARDRTWTFHAEDANPLTSSGTSLQCRVDNSGWEDCNDPESVPYTPTRHGIRAAQNLSDGPHTFEVRALDAAGNVDPTPAGTSFYVDGTDPEIDIARPADGKRHLLGEDLASDFTCTDPVVSGPSNPGIPGEADGPTNPGIPGEPGGTVTIDPDAPDGPDGPGPGQPGGAVIIDPDAGTPVIIDPDGPGPGQPGGPPILATPISNSGIKSCEGPAKVDTSTLGEHTFTVRAEDNAGNTSSKTTTYFVDPPKYTDVIGSGNPIAYYRLGDPEGSAAMTDSSGNGHHGEYKNGIKLGQPPAPVCQARPNRPAVCAHEDEPGDFSAAFPERDGYAYANGISAPQSGYSIEAWIKRNGTGDGSIAGQGGGAQLFVKDGKLALRLNQDTVAAPGPVLEPGQWWHVAATWNGHLTRLFVNGEEVASSDSANKAPSGGGTFYVGYGDQAPWFHGDLDEVAYYGRALSEEEVFTRHLVGTVTDPQDEPALVPLSAPDTTEPVDVPETTEPEGGPDTTEPVDETPGSTIENESGPSGDEPPAEPASSGPSGDEGPAGPAATGPSGKIAKKKAARKKAALKKCKRIKKAPKRRKCIRRVQARF